MIVLIVRWPTSILEIAIIDGLVKSLKVRFFVIPVQAGIQCFQVVRIIWIPVFTGMTTFYDSIIIGFQLKGRIVRWVFFLLKI